MRELEHGHDSASIRRRLAAGPPVSYLRDWVYGGIDGAVTTFAIVAGVVGADLSSRVVLILGAANLVGDGFSMAAGNFSGTRAEREEYGQPTFLRTPWKAALSTFAAFLLCGSVPLLPFVVDAGNSFSLALAATALVFFGIGSVKSRWSATSWWQSGLETLAVGLAAATFAFVIGYGLKGLV